MKTETMVPFCDAGADVFVPTFTCLIPKTETRATFVDDLKVEFTDKTSIEELVRIVLQAVAEICPGDPTVAIFERRVNAVGIDKFTLSGKIYRYAEETTASAG